MRRSWRWASRVTRHTVASLVVAAVAAGLAVLLAPATWGEAERMAHAHLSLIDDVIRPGAERVVRWLGVREARGGDGRAVTISGSARIVDGDTLDVDGRRIRLHGIDAPESAQTCRAQARRWPCGRKAARALGKRIAGRSVQCEERDRDRYGRIVAVCRAGGEDLNGWMVREGWALAYRTYSLAYADEERRARQARRGVWRGEFVAPWAWRRGERLAGEGVAPKANHEACRIKGNISRNGTRIYHVPGGRYYARTRIDVSQGERWFCSEAEARDSGWRRSKR